MFHKSVNGYQNFTDKIPEFASNYKREYQFIIGINKEFKYIIDKLDNLNNGLFESKTSHRIKNFMKRCLRAQERCKLKDISDLVFPIEYLGNINFMNSNFGYYKLRYDFFDDDDDDDDDEKPYPGFKELYDIFKKFFNQLNFECRDSDEHDSDEYDSDIDKLNFSFTASDLEDVLKTFE